MDAFDLVATLGYSSHLDRAAARLARCGDDLRGRSSLLVRASEQCGWDSAGARAFRRRQADCTNGLSRAADLLDDTAQALRRHAYAVAAAAGLPR